MAKIKIYIDGANMFYTQKKLGWTFDWAKIKSEITKNNEVLGWRYYIAVKDDDLKVQKYLKYLDMLGFDVSTKKLKKIKIEPTDPRFSIYKSEHIFKANFDIEIATDILLDKTKIDEVILFSGDSDFEYLVKKLKDSGVRVVVWSSRRTISWELKLRASKIVYFEDNKGIIERK